MSFIDIKNIKDINIDIGITQLPTSVIEQERLSHYFKDPLTNLYNMQYLNLILDSGINKEYYQYIYVLALKDLKKASALAINTPFYVLKNHCQIH